MILVHNISEIPEKLFNLARKLEENVELFCQLDYLIRETPICETKNVEMQLLIQNLLDCSKNTPGRIFRGGFKTSLAVLGCVAQGLMSKITHVVIESSAQTAAVCSLFTDLCHQVGLKEKVRLALLDDNDIQYSSAALDLKEMHVYVPKSYNCYLGVSELKNGIVGIVSAKSDVESAVDTFLASTDRFPWNVTKILLQEGVMEHFKKSLEWKINSTRDKYRNSYRESRIIDDKLRTLSAAAYNYEKKIFLFEFTGKELDEDSFGIILVDAYRTTKELLAMLKGTNHFGASIWCNDIAESNEIAFNIESNIIWINDFCNFTGPPKSAQAFYSLVDAHFSTALIKETSDTDELMKLRESWLAIKKTKREDIVRNILKNAPMPKNSFARKMEMEKLDLKDIDAAFDNFSFVENNTLCYGVEMRPFLMKSIDPLDVATVLFILKGGGVVIDSRSINDNDAFTKYVFEELRDHGAPILSYKESFRYGIFRILASPIYKMKVVWSRFGTIFAN
ncbi:uncharacterized protein LOC112047054 [Bicyclus anynana]|uniref:Uncharacterized protein LOC112047054 n=1 Tax=Bicyclus anynana TaxID=110368 RepID=A0ABM3LXT8_BICAN|nr:uncharacterized protein LOC112047054 [Bicyclus anynana]